DRRNESAAIMVAVPAHDPRGRRAGPRQLDLDRLAQPERRERLDEEPVLRQVVDQDQGLGIEILRSDLEVQRPPGSAALVGLVSVRPQLRDKWRHSNAFSGGWLKSRLRIG